MRNQPMLETIPSEASAGTRQTPAGVSRIDPSDKVARAGSISRATLAGLIALGLLLVVLYWAIALKMFRDWIDYPEYSHGLLIPFFLALLIWERRESLTRVRVQSSWVGLLLAAFGFLVLLLGVFGADLFLSRFSFVLLSAGLIWTLLGRLMLKQCAFPLFVLFLAIPLPTLLLNHVTFPLQIFASKLASVTLPLAGVPVLREGNVITLPAMPLEVAEACSGIRSLMSLFTVAVIYGSLMERRTSLRILLAFASVPIAVIANVARIVGTGLCVQYWDPEKALGFFHEFSGWVLFLVSLSCLYLLHRALIAMTHQPKWAK